MKLYQCSRCKCLYDGGDDHVYCTASVYGGDPRYRTKEGAELCRQNYEPLNENEIWHEPFRWETSGLKFEYFENYSRRGRNKSDNTKQIIKALLRGEKQSDIAKRLGVTRQAVSFVKRKYVDGNDETTKAIRKDMMFYE